jgi:GNAT superfamily N-acetyltransferase
MVDKLEIRKATSVDIPMILKLYAQKDIDDGNVLSIDDANRIFDKFQIYPNYTLYLAEIENLVVGTFELLIMDNLAHKGSKSGIVEDVIVDSNYRSKGVGRKMMEYAMDVCRDNNCYKLTLSSSIHRDRAHKFYENLGFKKHGYSFLIAL